jgi:hypothetical protein
MHRSAGSLVGEDPGGCLGKGTAMSEHRDQPRDGETVEELAEEAEERNPDPTTRREALELDLAGQDRSEEGTEVGQSLE